MRPMRSMFSNTHKLASKGHPVAVALNPDRGTHCSSSCFSPFCCYLFHWLLAHRSYLLVSFLSGTEH